MLRRGIAALAAVIALIAASLVAAVPAQGANGVYCDADNRCYLTISMPSDPAPNPDSNGAGLGRMQTPLLCALSGWQTPLPAATLRAKYGSPANYVSMVEARLDELEAEGWSLPVYRDIILRDARAVRF